MLTPKSSAIFVPCVNIFNGNTPRVINIFYAHFFKAHQLDEDTR